MNVVIAGLEKQAHSAARMELEDQNQRASFRKRMISRGHLDPLIEVPTKNPTGFFPFEILQGKEIYTEITWNESMT